MYYTYPSWEELTMMIRADWAEYALHRFLKIAGVDGSLREVRGNRRKWSAAVRRPKKPPSTVARRSQNKNPANET